MTISRLPLLSKVKFYYSCLMDDPRDPPSNAVIAQQIAANKQIVIDKENVPLFLLQQQQEFFKSMQDQLSSNLASLRQEQNANMEIVNSKFSNLESIIAPEGQIDSGGSKSPEGNPQSRGEKRKLKSVVVRNPPEPEPPRKKPRGPDEEFRYQEDQYSDFIESEDDSYEGDRRLVVREDADDQSEDGAIPSPETFFGEPLSPSHPDEVDPEEDFLSQMSALVDDKRGPDLGGKGLADRAKSIWQAQVQKDKVSELGKDNLIPKNCEFLKVQWMNSEIFYAVDRYVTKKDKLAQRQQALIQKAATPILKAMDSVMGLKPGDTISAECLSGLRSNLLSSFSFMSFTNSNIISQRKQDCQRACGPSCSVLKSDKSRDSISLFSDDSTSKCKKDLKKLTEKKKFEEPQKSSDFKSPNYPPRRQQWNRNAGRGFSKNYKASPKGSRGRGQKPGQFSKWQ